MPASQVTKLLEEAQELLRPIRTPKGSVRWRQNPGVARKILELFLESGLSGTEFEDQVGVSRSTLIRFQQGQASNGAPWPELMAHGQGPFKLPVRPPAKSYPPTKVFEDPPDPQLVILLEEARGLLEEMRQGRSQLNVMWAQNPEKAERLLHIYTRSGLQRSDWALAVGVSLWSWLNFLRDHQEFQRFRIPRELSDRSKDVLAFVAAGNKQSRAAQEFGISRQRVSQIIKSHGARKS